MSASRSRLPKFAAVSGIVLLLTPVLTPAIAVFCLVAGVRAVAEERFPKSTGLALIATVLPAAVYGCTVWGTGALIPIVGWAGALTVSLVAGVVTLVPGLLSGLYIYGYSMGVAKAKAAPPRLKRVADRRPAIGTQMPRPIRRGPH